MSSAEEVDVALPQRPEPPQEQWTSPSGYRRPKVTRRSVLLADRIAERTITFGGIFVIVAVMGIMVFLIAETLPLFQGGAVTGSARYHLSLPPTLPIAATVDEYRAIAVEVGTDGALNAFHPPTGTRLEVPGFDLGGGTVSAFAATPDGTSVAFGFADGSVRFGELRFPVEVLLEKDLPADLKALGGDQWSDGRAVFARIPGGQVRRVSIETVLNEPVAGSSAGHRLVGLDYRVSGSVERPTRAFVALDDTGGLFLTLAEARKNMMTGKTTLRSKTVELPRLPEGFVPARLLMTSSGGMVYVADAGGEVRRYNAKTFDRPFLAETARITPEGVPLTALTFLIGESALLVGGGDGSLSVYFPANVEGAETPDGVQLIKARDLESHAAAVTHLAPSQRGKTFVSADASGAVWVRHATSEKTLIRLEAQAPSGHRELLLAPRVDGLLLVEADGRANYWEIDIPHPETSWRTLFGKVWYEGYPEPSYTWQSTGMTDAFEPKLSMIPLIFGTLKGTLYSMLFAIPIAMLAAIYTSEFLHPRVRGVVKPMMEMMASLPSVVLGFVAALVLAPLVETWIAAVLLGFLVVPGTLLGCAYLWQFLPTRLAVRFGGVPKLLLILLAVLVGLWLTYRVGPGFEQLFFAGDLREWLSGRGESARPFLFLLLLPLAFGASAMLFSRFGGLQVRAAMRRLGGGRAAALDALRWLGTSAAACGLAYLLALVCDAAGLDPRGTFVGTYAQRNTLVIGFAMGFAVIPIIYTLAEDALNAVPEHLRGASLGCGATPWQTALWVILPTAMSGVFSAVMIGMGRAVGETMIVVMAAGNTPLLDWNVFNGLRALSANIAVELPEAVKGGTLYRTLFLSALVLFAMTFVINTLAEVIRQRFRKRSMQL